MSGVTIVKIKSEDDGIRLNRWFLKYYPGLSLGRFQKLLRTKQIKVDGQKAEASTRLSVGQEVRVPPLDNEKKPVVNNGVSERDAKYVENMVIYKDENIIIINKPSGLAVQGGTNTAKHIDGMLDALKFEKEEKPKLVHRIDKDTSGILVLARNRKTADVLTKAFREHTLKKTYLALARGVPVKQEGEIKAPLEKVDGKVQVTDGGKAAITEYKVVDFVGERYSLIEASPLTGRTHQIRVHLEHINAPILGDNKYFGKDRERSGLFKDKLHLHSYKIDLSAVCSKKLVIKAPLPDYFRDSLKTLGIKFRE